MCADKINEKINDKNIDKINEKLTDQLPEKTSENTHGNLLELVLVRHGITQWNAERRYLGHADLPLLPDHAGLLPRLKEQLAASGVFQQVWCSDLLRCRETLSAIAPSPSLLESAVYDWRLREMNFGDWEGLTYEQLKDYALYRSWIDDPTAITPPNGESWEHFAGRVSSFLGSLRTTMGADTEADIENTCVEGQGSSLYTGIEISQQPGAELPRGSHSGLPIDSIAEPTMDASIELPMGCRAEPPMYSGAELSMDLINAAPMESRPQSPGGTMVQIQHENGEHPAVQRVLVVTHGGVIRELLARTREGASFREVAPPQPGTFLTLRLRWGNGKWSEAKDAR